MHSDDWASPVSLSSSLDGLLRQLAGQRPPAVVRAETAGGDARSFLAAVTQLGIRRYMVLATLVMLVAMIAPVPEITALPDRSASPRRLGTGRDSPVSAAAADAGQTGGVTGRVPPRGLHTALTEWGPRASA